MSKKNKKSKGKNQMEDLKKEIEEMEEAAEGAVEPAATEKAEKDETSEETVAKAETEPGNAKGEQAEGTETEPEADAETGAKEEEKDSRQAIIDDLEDKVKRQLAEFDNFRKRTEKEKEGMFEAGARSVIEKLLPVVDNFERGLASIPEEEQGSANAEGMKMIYKQLMGELEKLDVKPIEAVGTEFNPELHNAVMQCESDEYESGIVAQELLKGYTYRDTVIRHSMVAVVS